MAAIKSYKNKKGETLYRLQAYLGTDKATGKRVRVTRTGFKSEREALLEFSRLMLEHEETGLKKGQPVRFKELYEGWLQGYKNTVKESTLNKTLESFRLHILPAMGEMIVQEISVKEAQSALNSWSEKLVNFRLVKGHASSVMKHGLRLGIIEKNPFELVIMPRAKKKKEDEELNFYDKVELQKFLESTRNDMGQKWYTFFRLLAFTGIRKGEAIALTWDDIDLENQQITINKTVSIGMNNQIIVQEPKTSKSKRIISIDDRTVMELELWKKEQEAILKGFGHKVKKKNQLLFSTSKNGFIPLPQPGRVVNKVCKKNDLRRITVHGFRHSHCSLLFEAGLNIKEIQDRLGHSDIKTTMNIYTHITQKKRDEVADKFAEFVEF